MDSPHEASGHVTIVRRSTTELSTNRTFVRSRESHSLHHHKACGGLCAALQCRRAHFGAMEGMQEELAPPHDL